MELLQDVELRKKYDKCKYAVKRWEQEFKKKYARVPSKLDIREADKEVREAYRTYFHLKLQALDNSFANLDGFSSDEEAQKKNSTQIEDIRMEPLNDVKETLKNISDDKTWGKHLNYKPEKSVAQEKVEQTDFNTSLSQKLFKGTKVSKRNPRKSLSFTQRKGDVSKPSFLSQPTCDTATVNCAKGDKSSESCSLLRFNSTDNICKTDSNRLMTAPEKSIAVPINLLQNLVENEATSKRTVDIGWLQRISKEVEPNLSVEKQSEEIDRDNDIIYSSGDEDLFADVAQPQKRIRFDSDDTSTIEPLKELPSNVIEQRVQNEKLIIEQTEEKIETTLDTQKSITKKVAKTNIKSKTSKKPQSNIRRSLRTKKQIAKLSFTDEADNNSDSSEKSVEKRSTEQDVAEITSYELEYSVKPRVTSVPRIRSVKDLLKATKSNRYKEEKLKGQDEGGSLVESKRQQLKKKLEKKIESGTLNENYVTINLKKKIYARGRKTMNFSKYKKLQWKKHNKAKALAGPEMDMGGCDGGMLTCFNCGQIGHFARHCKQTKEDTLLSLDTEEHVSYPTLEEASQLAKNSVLAIRKPKGILSSAVQDPISSDGNENDEHGIFDDDLDEELLAETLKLEETLKQQEYIDQEKTIQPVYNLNEDGSIKETPSEVYAALQKFGHTTFRQGQEQAVMRILSGKSTLVTLCTGSGKSLCYQLPAYIYSQKQHCITLVISPLVSLMEDQVIGIPSFLKAACYHTNQTKAHREKVMDLIASGDLNVLLVSPEIVVAGEKATGFGSIFRKLPPIAFACIDEVHCVSQWSHNFRPSYLMLCRVLHDRLGVKTILGLTATATLSTCASIVEHLCIPDGNNSIIKDIPLPDNLVLTVSKDVQKDEALLGLLLSDRLQECRSIIVYCTRRDECERIASFLRTSLKYEKSLELRQKKRKRTVDVQAEPYHAGMSASKRKAVQKAFMSGELRIVVATVAFGMGINKSDIRAVIHYNMPKNFESYVQEIGRAGRDGLPAHCHLFLDFQDKDINELRRHIHANTIDRHIIRRLLQKTFIPCSCENICPKHEVAFSIEETVRALDIPEENISTLLCYLELHKKKYVQVLSPAYVTCKVISYGGSNEIRKAAKECPPLAMALVLFKDKISTDGNVIEFPVVEIAAAMGWDSGICKHKLKNLEWISVNNQPKRSLLNVQFSNLGFRVLAPGNLSPAELDEALDSLYDHVVTQEKTALQQLHALHNAVKTAAQHSYKNCTESNQQLKEKIRNYFESETPVVDLPVAEDVTVNEEKIVNDVRTMVFMYKDNVFNGRTIARIFHGIQSPNYPAVIWGRCKFWRAHINTDFHTICRIATAEILKLR